MAHSEGNASRPRPGARWGAAAVPVLVGLVAGTGTLVLLDLTGDDRVAGQPNATAVTSSPPGEAGRRPAVHDRLPAKPVDTGRAVFARMGCGNCHAFRRGNSDGGFGAPDLDAVVAGHTRDSLRADILEPYPEAPADFFPIMPTDYARRMSDAELEALVSFLLAGR